MAAPTDPTTDQRLTFFPAEAGEDVDVVWHTMGEGGPAQRDPDRIRPRQIVAQFVIGVVAVFALVGVTGAYAARQLAERESVNDAATRANILADAVVTPALTRALMAGQPAAVSRFDRTIRTQVLTDDVVRVKVWLPDGTVVYADEPQLVGQTFDLDPEQQDAIAERSTHAEISRLDSSENAFEEGTRLVEVYRPVWFPDGTVGLFEIYTSYDPVGARSTELWQGFAAITLSSLLVLLVLLTPIVWHLLRRTRTYEQQRAAWLERSVDASDAERRRIAGTLHDGPVQELAAAAFSVAGAAASAERDGHGRLAADLDAAAASVRGGIAALRDLVTDIHPAALEEDGLAAGLQDLAHVMDGPDLRITVDADPAAVRGLSHVQDRALFRLAQESLRNAAKHAGPAAVTVRLRREGDEVVLDVIDDGRGFDLPAALEDPEPGHLGLRVLSDLARGPGLRAQVATAPGRGTHWRFTQQVAR